ncbi:MAG: hypothetical protein IT579_19200 [Verrucomicrobia subdivision 3 bacterium]|nr:hypothetical protein [Limisphaerales bacterium]
MNVAAQPCLFCDGVHDRLRAASGDGQNDRACEHASHSGNSLALRPGDFYFDRGLMVFAGAYHLRRGYCCGNGCRHCPYPVSK